MRPIAFHTTLIPLGQLWKNIYVYCHPHTDCFVLSPLFSVARYVGRFKLGSKPAQHLFRSSIIPLSQQVTFACSGIIRHYIVDVICLHFALPDTRVLNSLEELCITRMTVVNSFDRVLNLMRGEGLNWLNVYIGSHIV